MSEHVDHAQRAARTGEVLARLLSCVGELERLHPGRPFTLDGHLVGSLGETAAEALFDIVLTPPGAPGHDAVTPAGRKVEIKATFGRSGVGIRPTSGLLQGAALIVLRLTTDPGAAHEIVYNGPLASVHDVIGPYGSNGQARIGLNRLRALDRMIPPEDRVPRRVDPTLPASED